ncbi:RTA1-domain-containing protein [Hypoxylon trugodes]|uniref:RTA1-domain-containing protein n=1 Tax=Hypoxylon trugodes TaxID=326681 RepID=UPI00218F5C45|nr:RTA1-domain-containing protein [Hypoxylon trugodes]KAI1390473.1 RTA1-domain-containing protein [Hypoxylon trugodes]
MGSDGPFGPVVNGTQIVFFEYRPNKTAAFSFIALFALATLGHFIYFALRAWFFLPFILGGIAETFGYYGRAWASDSPDELGPFIMQNLLILAAPPFLAATIYMTLGRIITSLGAQRRSWIKPSWITKIYVLIDIGCIVTQLGGSAILASGDPSAISKSKTILLAGLITQIVTLSFFVLNSWHLYSRCKRDMFLVAEKDLRFNWHNHFRAILVVAPVMIVRSIVRTVEFLQGNTGFVASREVFIYVFDAFLMFFIMLVFLIIHPGRLVRDARRI